MSLGRFGAPAATKTVPQADVAVEEQLESAGTAPAVPVADQPAVIASVHAAPVEPAVDPRNFNATRVSAFNPWTEIVREVDAAAVQRDRGAVEPAPAAPAVPAQPASTAPPANFAPPVSRTAPPAPHATAPPAAPAVPAVPAGPDGPTGTAPIAIHDPSGPASPPTKLIGAAVGGIALVAIVGALVASHHSGGPKQASDPAISQLITAVRAQQNASFPIGSTKAAETYEMAGRMVPVGDRRPVTLISRDTPTAKRIDPSTAIVTTHAVFEQRENLPARYLKSGKSRTKRAYVTWTQRVGDLTGRGDWDTSADTKVHIDRYEIARRPTPTGAAITDAEKNASAVVEAGLGLRPGQSSASYNAAQPDAYLTKKMPGWKIKSVVHAYGGNANQYPPIATKQGWGSRNDVLNDLLMEARWVCLGDVDMRSSAVKLGTWQSMKPTLAYIYDGDPDLQHVQVKASVSVGLNAKCKENLGIPASSHQKLKTSATVLLARPADTDLDGTWRAEAIQIGKIGSLYQPEFDSEDYAKQTLR